MQRREFLSMSAGALLAGGLAGQSEPDLRVGPRSSPPARKMAAFRLQELTSHSRYMRMTMHCLQGLVNRTQPRLFLVEDHYDELWLDWLRERGDVDEVEWLDVGQVFDRFGSAAKCMFVIDPAVRGSINVATMLAAVHSGLVAAPETAGMFDLPMGAYPDSNKMGMDLRTMHWRRDLDAYKWVYTQIGDRLSRKAIAYLDPDTDGIRDYFVEFGIPILWISNPAGQHFEEEREFAKEVLLKWPANIPCMGWPLDGPGIGEWEGVRLASECGKFEVCSGYDGYSPTVTNLSVHSGTSARFQQKMPPVRLGRDKIYYAFIRSDGDGLNFQRHYYRKLFDDPQHGRVPLGWHIGPTATDFMPDILDYYYKHARPGDCFVNALTGVGYIHEDNYADNYPSEKREQIWSDFLKLSALYRERMDASVLVTFAEMAPERLARFASIPGFQAIFANYGRTHITTLENQVTVVGGKPVFRSINRGPGEGTFTPYGRRNAEAFMVTEIRQWTPSQRPAFLHVFLANWLTHMEMADNIARRLGPEYVAVRPDQLADLHRQANG